MKKKLSLLLAACVLLSSLLCGCARGGAVAGETGCAVSYGSLEVPEGVYRYWFSCYKYLYLSYYSSLGIRDTEEGWAAEYRDGESYGQAFCAAIRSEIARRVLAAALFDDAGYRLSDADTARVLAAVDDLFYYDEGEDRNAILSPYGITEEGARRVAAYELKYRRLYAAMFGSSGEAVLTSAYREQADAYFASHCRRVLAMFVPDSADQAALRGAVPTMTEEQFLSFYYNIADRDVLTLENYPKGFYLLDGQNYGETALALFPEVLQLAFSAEMGACEYAPVEGGTYYVLRCELEEDAYRNTEYEDMFAQFPLLCAQELYADFLVSKEADLVGSAYVDAFTMMTAEKNGEYNVVQMLNGGSRN